MAKKVNRSAKDGKFVDQSEADANPDTTVAETKSKSKSQARRRAATKPTKKGFKFYRSHLAGLSLVLEVGDPLHADSIKRVRFTPYLEKHQGDDVKVGYLTTDDPKAQKR